jgi:hypothetical protein
MLWPTELIPQKHFKKPGITLALPAKVGMLWPTELIPQKHFKKPGITLDPPGQGRDDLVPKILPLKAVLDFRGCSKNQANQRFAVFRHQLS